MEYNATEIQWNDFITRKGERLAAYIRRKMQDVRDAEEVYNDTLFELYRNYEKCQSGHIEAYAMGIATNLIHNRIRANQKHEYEIVMPLMNQYIDDRAQVDLAVAEAQEDLISYIRQKNPTIKEVLRLRLSGYRIKEIAIKMGLTTGQTQMILSRLRKQFREYMS